jgi:hypothetical protein
MEVYRTIMLAILVCMKPTIVKEKVTLESIARSISKLATKEEISKLVTKDEMSKSIDDLAGAVKKGFDEVHGKFAKIDENLIKIDERFDTLELKVDRMDSRFTNQLDYFNLWYPTKQEFTNLDDRMKKVEKRLRLKI